MDNRKPIAGPVSNADDAFCQTVVRYLDGQATAEELAAIERDLTEVPPRRHLFLDICLQAALIAETGVSSVPTTPEIPVTPGVPKATRMDSPTHPLARARALLETARQEASPVDQAGKPEVLRYSRRSFPSRTLVLGFLNKMLHVGYETPAVNALMWLVMAVLFSGIALTIVFCVMLVYQEPDAVARHSAPQVAGSWNADKETRKHGNPDIAAPADPRVSPPPRLPDPASSSQATVARLIDTAECHWAMGSHSPHLGDDLESGRKLELLSGVAEVMFQSGVRALLQGPATMEIGSRSSALLRVGTLTVRVEDPDGHGFVVYAPGVKYTDLGTEFGVWVAKDGRQEMQVFRGAVMAEQASEISDGKSDSLDRKHELPNLKAQISNEKSETSQSAPRVVTANQAVRVAAPGKPIEQVPAKGKQFIRAMPAPAPFAVFGTGVGLDRGDADPHWSITKISGDAEFKGQPAVVAEPHPSYVRDSRKTGQWISTSKLLVKQPDGCRWTYRTQFDLSGFDPSTARLEGRVSVDDYVAEIRLNGKAVPLPAGARDDVLCKKWLELKIEEGFVSGKNTLEIVIENAAAPEGAINVMGLCVECKGTARLLATSKSDE